MFKYQYVNFKSDTVLGLAAITDHLGAHKTNGKYNIHHTLVNPAGFTAMSNAAGDHAWSNGDVALANTTGYYKVNLSPVI